MYTENFEILFPQEEMQCRPYSKEEVIIKEGPHRERSLRDVDIETRIEEYWLTECEKAVASGKKVPSSNAKVRFGNYILSDGKIQLGLALTTWREFLGTNVRASENISWREELIVKGKDRYNNENALFANPLSVCSVVETEDAQIFMGLRSTKVRMYPSCWHVIGGTVEPRNNGEVDIFDNMERELIEELYLDVNEIDSLKLLGIVRNRHMLHYEAAFVASLRIPFEALLEKTLKHEVDEHKKIAGIEKEGLINFVKRNQTGLYAPRGIQLTDEEKKEIYQREKQGATNYFVPTGEAALLLYLMQDDIKVAEKIYETEQLVV